MPTPELKTTVTYSSGTSVTLGAEWDVMHVVARRDDGEQNSFVIARDLGGNIIRKTDLVYDRWEIVNDKEDLQHFQHCFDERDRLITEKAANLETAKDLCKCGHPFSSHTRDIRETSGMRVDDALLRPKGYDINTDRPVGESGCTECACRQWERAV
jgi:hypothetical protein